MKNINYGSNAVTATDAKGKEKVAVEERPEVSAKDVLKTLTDAQKKLAELAKLTEELYDVYPTNEMSTALNSIDMVNNSYQKLFDKVEQFGK